MGRSLLIMVFFLGLFASMMTRGGHFSAAGNARQMTDGSRDPGQFASHDPRASQSSDGSGVEIPRNSDGHFYADVQINGATVHMLVDTGATGIALSREDAGSAGVATSIGMNDVVGEGADGSVHGEYVRLDRVELGGTSASGLEAIVLNSGDQSLLGQEFLAKFDSVEIHGDTMVLK